MDRNLQLAWAAGFLDGEGYIGLSRGTTKLTGRFCHQLIIDVAQAKRPPLEMLVDLFGGKIRVGKNWCGTISYWRVTGTQAALILAEVAPYLIGKRQQAALGLEFARTLMGIQGVRLTDEVMTRREAVYLEFRALNQRRRPSHAERLSEPAPLALVAEG